MKVERGERPPLDAEKLEARRFVKAVGVKAIDQSRDERTELASKNFTREEVHGERGEGERQHQRHVLSEERIPGRVEERSGQQGRTDQVLRESEGRRVGVERVRVEEVKRIAGGLVRVPREDPRDMERVAVVHREIPGAKRDRGDENHRER